MSIEYPCVHWNEGKCKKFSDGNVTSYCVESPCKDQKPSNADRIRAMTDAELAFQLIQYRDDWGDYCTHKGCYATQKGAIEAEIEWLKQPVEDAYDG